MIRLFTGWDAREAAGWHAFAQSVIENTSVPVSIIPLTGQQKDGTNAFTYARFLVPQLCDFAGHAIFADAADMLALGDIADLWALRNSKYAVQVVKHDYKTKHPKKYLGTPLEADNRDYPRKNWSSLIIWNCAHLSHYTSREKLRSGDGAFLHRFAWLKDSEIGDIPPEWNWLADEAGENENAKILHWTCGIPGFFAYRDSPHASLWRDAVRRAQKGID